VLRNCCHMSLSMRSRGRVKHIDATIVRVQADDDRSGIGGNLMETMNDTLAPNIMQQVNKCKSFFQIMQSSK